MLSDCFSSTQRKIADQKTHCVEVSAISISHQEFVPVLEELHSLLDIHNFHHLPHNLSLSSAPLIKDIFKEQGRQR